MPDLEALQAQIDALTAQIAALRPPAPPAPETAPVEPEPPRPVRLHTLTRGIELGGLDRDVRAVRQLVEALAFCRGAPSPSHEIPADWMPQLRALAAARAAGRSWREALGVAGLEVPGDLEVQARAVRLELDGLWGRVLPLTGLVLDSINSTAKITLGAFLKRILT